MTQIRITKDSPHAKEINAKYSKLLAKSTGRQPLVTDVMTLNYFNDFYVLEAIMAELSQQIASKPELAFKRSVVKLEEDVREYMKGYCEEIAKRTMEYLWCASLGEARHASTRMTEEYFIPDLNMMSRGETFIMATEFRPNSHNIDVVRTIFKQRGWGGSFGGKAWANIVDAVSMYGNVSDTTFLDHVIDLEHNSGTVFNKTEARLVMDFDLHYDGNFRDFLDFKFSHSVLKRSPRFYVHTTGKTYRMALRACNIFGLPEPMWLKPALPKLSRREVDWGHRSLTLEKKWRKGADCSKGNTPNAKMLLYRIEFDQWYGCTKSSLLIKAKTLHKKLMAEARKYGIASSELKDVIQEKVEEFTPFCATEKIAKPYMSIAVKMRATDGLNIQIPVRTQFGKPTAYGTLWHNKSTFGIHTGRLPDTGFDGTPHWINAIMTCKDGNKIKLTTIDNQWWLNDGELSSLLEVT